MPRPPLAAGAAARSRSTRFVAAARAAQRRASGRRLACWRCCSLFAALASRELNGRAFRWLPVLILVGSVGFWDRAHVLSPRARRHLGVAIALVRLRARAAPARLAAASWLGVGAAVAFLAAAACTGPLWLALTARAAAAASARRGARARYAATVARRARGRAARSSLPGRSRCMRAIPRCSRSGGERDARPTTSRSSRARRRRARCTTCAICRGSRGRRCRSSLWTLWTRGRGFNGGLREPGVEIPGVLALVILVEPAGRCPSRALINALPLLVPLALLAALEVDSLKRGFSACARLVRHPDVRPARRSLVWGLWIDARVNGMSRASRVLFRDTEIGFQPTFHLGAMLLAAVPDGAVGRARAPGAAQQPPRGAQLGGRRDAALGPRTRRSGCRTSIRGAAIARSIESARARSCLRRAASRAATWASRSARCSTISPGSTPCARKRSPTHECPRCSCSTAGSASAPRRRPAGTCVWDGRRRGDDTERFVLYRRNAP